MDLYSVLQQLSDGMLASVIIFILTLLISLPLGLVVALGRMSKIKIIQYIVTLYVSIMRGTPLMLQLLVVYFGPYYIFHMKISATYQLTATIIGFSLNYAAYFGETYRSGIQSIPVGHREAAKVLGYSKFQTFFKIIFPQMVKHVLPPVTNEIITLVKDTSLAFVLAYEEMFTIAKQLSATQANVIPLFIAGLFYYIFNLIVAMGMGHLEKRLSYYH